MHGYAIGLVLAMMLSPYLAVAVFLRDAKADAEARDATIARVARAAWDRATTTKR